MVTSSGLPNSDATPERAQHSSHSQKKSEAEHAETKEKQIESSDQLAQTKNIVDEEGSLELFSRSS